MYVTDTQDPRIIPNEILLVDHESTVQRTDRESRHMAKQQSSGAFAEHCDVAVTATLNHIDIKCHCLI